MRTPFAIAALFSVFALPAFAADLPNVERARESAPQPPVFSWSGFYLGANAGLSGGNFNTSDRVGTYGSGDQNAASSRGFSGGGQLGYNYQLPRSNFVVGIEADFQGSTLQGTYDTYQVPGGSGGGWQDASKVDWWGTVRGRVGYAVGNFLPYATGGLAYGHVETNGSCWAAAWPFGCDQSQGSVSGTHIGWTVGGGLESVITQNLTFKVEYLYTDLGSVDVPNNYLDAAYGGTRYSLGDEMQTRTTFSTVRIGLNYKFDASAAPGMEKPFALAAPVLALPAFGGDLPSIKAAREHAPPPQVFSWSGFYVGANAGLSAGNFNTSDRLGIYGSGDQNTADSRGFSVGGQLGYNYQFSGSNVVVGIEADFQGSTLKGSYDDDRANGEAAWQDTSKVNWWGTARGRLGYAFGNFLPYATGGLAYGHVETNGSCWVAGGPFGCDQSQGAVSGTHVGWTAGGGLESAITHNLTFKVEYLYTDLGSVDVPNDYLDATYGGARYSQGDELQTRTTFSTIRVGVNYKFDTFAPSDFAVAE
ncbi:MAG TPA: outer membrane protein [Pseudolabrys sp.]|nr:outer membrane protein [Pseudolabrys sp.]